MPEALDRQIQETVANGRGYTRVLLWKGRCEINRT
jgi:hypothetical protein